MTMVSSLKSNINERHLSQIFGKKFSINREGEALSILKNATLERSLSQQKGPRGRTRYNYFYRQSHT